MKNEGRPARPEGGEQGCRERRRDAGDGVLEVGPGHVR